MYFKSYILPIANFAESNEKISSAQCKNRVYGTANAMRLLTTKIPNHALATTITYVISELEHLAYNCCERNHWTECLSPIINGWNYLKNCLDKGITIAPRLVGPGR